MPLLLSYTSLGTSLAVQQLRLRASTAGGTGPVPGRGTKMPHAMWHIQKIKIKSNTLHKFRLEV